MQDRSVYEEFRESVRRFAVEKVAPHAARHDAEGAFPEEVLAAAEEAGFLRLFYPERYGGDEGDLLGLIIFTEEIARVCASSALTLFATPGVLLLPMRHGPSALADALVPKAMAGELICSFCLTEPDTGTDLSAIKTRARRDGDEWVINGQKQFITNAGRSDWYSVFLRTDEGGDTAPEFSVIYVHRDDPGFQVGKLERKMGHRGSPTGQLFFSDCRVPADRAIGEPGRGAEYIEGILVWSRALIAAEALGLAQGALDAALGYTSERTVFGQQVARFQMTRAMVADMAIAIESSRALLYRVAELYEDGSDRSREFVAMAKVLCTDTAMKVTTDACQLFGGYGYVAEYPVERMMRDAKVTQIWEGTNQINRLLVAKGQYQHRPAPLVTA